MSLKSTNKIDANQYELEVTIDAETFQKAVDQAFRRNIKRLNVPGFRRGKAPRHVVERLYGEGVFYEDAVNIVYPQAYQDAAEEAKIEPVDRADIEVVSVGKEGVDFKAKVTVKPEVEIGQYKTLAVQKPSAEATPEDVDAELARLQERNARMLTIEDRAAEKGDIADIDFEGFLDGKAFEGGKGEKYPLELGSGHFIPGFEDQVAGRKTGDEFEVNVTFPKDYGDEKLADKPVVFKVKLNAIRHKELPAIDNEFAKDVSEFDTLDALKDDLKKKIAASKAQQASEEVENKLTGMLVDALKADIPDVMVDRALENILGDMEYRLQMQGMNLASYLKYMGMSEDDYKKSIRPQAEQQVKTRLALEKIAELEKLEPTPEEVEDDYKRAADRYKVDLDKVKAAFPEKDIRNDIRVRKAMDFVRKNAIIAEAAPDEKKPKAAPKANDEKEPDETEPKKARRSTKGKSEEKSKE